MNFQQLEYFVVLAEMRHFRKAAERLCISQPALSNSIKALEAELGCQLFQRETRNIALTLEGNIFREHAVRILGDTDHAVKAVSKVHSMRGGSAIRIGVISSLARAMLPHLLADYMEGYPDCAPAIITEMDDIFECYQALKDDEIDIAFCGELSNEGMGWTPIASLRLVAAVNAAHPLADLPQARISDLAAFPIISYRHKTMLHNSIKAISESAGFAFREAFYDESSIACHLAVQPDAVALILDTHADSENDGICFIEVEELSQPFHQVGAAYHVSSLQDSEISRFVIYLQEQFSDIKNTVPINGFLAPKNIL